MKQTATNQFQDGLNKDLHPIVTPNSVLTDNLNGTFITYNGNEFCLQNDKGNVIKATLPEGFIPLGMKERNGVLYIVSHNPSTGESEIGTFPGVDWESKKEVLKPFLECYTPLHNFAKVLFKKKTVYIGNFFGIPLDLLHSDDISYTYKTSLIDAWSLNHHNPLRKLISTGIPTSKIYNLFFGGLAKEDYTESTIYLLDRIESGEECLNRLPSLGPAIKSHSIDGGVLRVVPDNIVLFGDVSEEDLKAFHSFYSESTYSNLLNNFNFSEAEIYKIYSEKGFSKQYDTEVDILNVTNALNAIHSTLGFKNVLSVTQDKSVNSDIVKEGYEFEIADFRTNLFNFDIEHPVSIEIQDSYDGSVNLILTDGQNGPKLINTGFSVIGDNYKLIENDKYIKDYGFDAQASLIKKPISFARIALEDVLPGGQLKGGNYTFYTRLSDSDGNMTGIISESSIVSIFKGTVGEPRTISGTLADERTDKMISLSIQSLTDGYSKLYLYYVREYSDTQGFLMSEAKQLTKPYDVIRNNNKGVGYCNIVVTGFEEETSINIEDLNVVYYANNTVKTMTQQQDMLFLGGVNVDTYNPKKFKEYAKLITTKLSRNDPDLPDRLDNIGGVSNDYTGNAEYYNVQNIYNKVGYWPGEYYRFGIVFILADGSNSNVYNMIGGNINFNKSISKIDYEYYPNAYNDAGVFRTCMQSGSNNIITDSSIIPWHFEFDTTTMKEQIEADDAPIKGFFIVRQKRIPEAIVQGMQVGIEDNTHLPCINLIKTNTIGSGYHVMESFCRSDEDHKLTYFPVSASGAEVGHGATYKVAIPVKLSFWGKPSIGWAIVGTIFCPELSLFAYDEVYSKQYSEMVYVIMSYDAHGENGNPLGVSTSPGNFPIRDQLELWYNTDKYVESSNYGTDNPWIRYKPTPKARSGSYIENDRWNAIKDEVLNHPNLYVGAVCGELYRTDPSKPTISEINKDTLNRIFKVEVDGSCSGLLSAEATLNPTFRNRLNGAVLEIQKIGEMSARGLEDIDSDNSSTEEVGIPRRIAVANYVYSSEDTIKARATYMPHDVKIRVVDDCVFSTVAGNAYDVSSFGLAAPESYSNLLDHTVRGHYTPYVGLCTKIQSSDNTANLLQLSLRTDPKAAFDIRTTDHSPFYTVSDRHAILDNDNIISVYRGDCYVTTQTIRLNSNFTDPNYPYTDSIVDPDGWKKAVTKYWGKEGDMDKSGWEEASISDLNTVSLGFWVTFKCLASTNIAMRSEDAFDTTTTALLGNPRSFFPLSGSTSTSDKQWESELLNAGYGITVGEVRYQEQPDVPYIKQEYGTRVMFSNKNVIDQFSNGYRIFQGASYQDYDKQYGNIIKLLPWRDSLFCVFEHGLALLPINEKALMQTTTDQTIHIYGHGVLPKQMTLISPDYGSKYADSVIKTALGIYGIDVDEKKIWRFTEKQGFETISDMKIETFLKNKLDQFYTIEIGHSDVRSHYNSFKGDVIFTWYNGPKLSSICFNERQSLWTTTYDWIPLISDNVNGQFYSLQKGEDSEGSVGIYKHSLEASPTKWYGKQHPFEFEFVVSDPIGVHKIYENLQIISNNVQPEELQFEFIGDSYLFNKARIYHTTKLSDFASDRIYTNETSEKKYRDIENTIYNKQNLVEQQNVGYIPFRNASKLNDRDSVNMGRIIQTDNATEQYHLVIPQECRNIETWGRRLGNIHYKFDSWYSNIEPIIYDAKLNNPDITDLSKPAKIWNSARIRDKWCKIRVRYSGEDLAVITAIKTIVNI